MSGDLSCRDPTLIGSGGFGYIISCKGDDKKKIKYVVKLPKDPYSSDCNLKLELDNSKYLNDTTFFTKPIIFDTKFGSENIIKYYDATTINGLNGMNVHNIYENTEGSNNQIRKTAVRDIQNSIDEAIRQNCFVAIEYCDKGDLKEFISNHSEYISQPSFYKDMVYQIFSSLVYLYNKKVCHWDIKPENILVMTNPKYGINNDNRKYLFKIADYGSVMINPTDEIIGRLYQSGFELMTKKNALKFIKENMGEISVKRKPNDIDPVDLVKNNNLRTYELMDIKEDICSRFQTTPIYTPPTPLTLTTFYRDIYAFVLTIFNILLKDDNPIKTKFKNEQDKKKNSERLPMSVLASKKREHNYIFQNKNSKIDNLVWNIARAVKDCEEKIITKSKYLYYIKPPDYTNKDHPTYYIPQKIIIDFPHEIYQELFERLQTEVFNTRIGKTLKNIHQRKIAAQTQKKRGQSTLGSQASSNNNFEPIFMVPENIEEDLLGNHIVFVNSSVLNSSTHRNWTSGQNSSGLAWNNESFGQSTTNLSQRPSFMYHQPPAYPQTIRNTSNY